MKAAVIAALITVSSGAPHAQTPTQSHADHHDSKAAANAAADAALADGEIRRIDREQQKITLRHGELKRLGMPPMTMVFRVADASWIDQFKVGDKVRFDADNINGAYTIVKLERAP